MRRFFFFLLLISSSFVPLKAQLALSGELLGAYPLYFKTADLGLATHHVQPGCRIGGYYYKSFEDQFTFIVGIRYTHHFTTTDSAYVHVSNNYTSMNDSTAGTAKSVFNSFVPQLGFSIRSSTYPLLTYRFLVGIGASWAHCFYNLPAYDPNTMSYFNPPWYASGRKNTVGKLYATLPCMTMNFSVLYELKSFFVYGSADLTYSLGDFPPTPVSVSAGILLPLSGKE